MTPEQKADQKKNELNRKLPPGFEIVSFDYAEELFGNVIMTAASSDFLVKLVIDRGLIEGEILWNTGHRMDIDALMKSHGFPMEKELLEIGVEGYSFDEFAKFLNDKLETIRQMSHD